MNTCNVQVRRVVITRKEIDFEHETAGADIVAAIDALVPTGVQPSQVFPLAKEHHLVELEGVPAVVANAIRRVLKDELRGHCLTFLGNDLTREATTDPVMSDEDFILTRIRMIPLRPQIPEALVKTLRFDLDARNNTATVMAVYSGDLIVVGGALTEPLFNPTHEIASLQPGRTLLIKNIHIVEGFGSQDAAFIVAVRGVSRPLDLEEYPREATHGPVGVATVQSGYLESSLVANPRRHEITGWLPAVPAGGGDSVAVLVDACGAIMTRLRYIQGVLEGASTTTHRAANAYFLVTLDGPRSKGVLGVRNETHTIGGLLSRSVYELMPDIAYVGYTCVPHEKIMKFTVSHTVSEPAEIAAIVTRAVKHAYGIFSKIMQGFRAKV